MASYYPVPNIYVRRDKPASGFSKPSSLAQHFTNSFTRMTTAASIAQGIMPARASVTSFDTIRAIKEENSKP